ncbi:ABC-type cobalamin/Fe3+-siderophores transport system ATPase subunit [Mycobacterium frederiksbergense]|uniref:ABC-type cobalamin/Fe3+-siderophores transport system ATPase subunit n=1 Tax=Mycolicibacterium frederiksbergense TaxID=117567 RepID=A0ABT6L656_9MYCO|nr:ATP-binding cassette domain-containing protein [Mycolicibacterium frederiksbergense]MDH6198427.1 ABC-type cobalamin/Fe3+-siderophores transport system ATPase subunit [Mycolicibacterium frederiksbergense]
MSQLSSEPGAGADEQKPEPVITARGIAMRGPWGPVYGPIDLDVEADGVTVLVAPSGTGRTALLMTLAGRMRPVRGELTVFGHTRATGIFRSAALAGIDELDTVSESVTVRDLVTEQRRWDAPWYTLVRRADEDDLAEVCAPVFGDLPLPSLTEYFDGLSELDQILLRIALANTKTPPLLVVGNLDHLTDDRNRDVLVGRLIALGEKQTVITATVNGVPEHLVPAVRAQLNVPNTTLAELAGAQKGGE